MQWLACGADDGTIEASSAWGWHLIPKEAIMANCKQASIRFTIPFDFGSMGLAMATSTDEERAEDRRRIERAQLALFQMCTMPGIGLTLTWRECGHFENDHGGKTCRYEGEIVGTEAFSWGAFDDLKKVLSDLPGVVILKWQVHDIEA
jgi:hypothetical protein